MLFSIAWLAKEGVALIRIWEMWLQFVSLSQTSHMIWNKQL